RKVLKNVCGFTRGGPSASLFWQDAARKTGNSYFVWGGEARFGQLYWEKYIALNPFTPAAGSFPVEQLYSAADVLPPPEFIETEFYKEWMSPQGWGDVLSVNLDKTATGRAVFSIARHARDGMVDEEMRHRVRLLVPHVRRAVMIGKLTARNGDQFVTHVLPLTTGARRKAGVAYSAVAAVFVQRAGNDTPPSLDALAERYQLTPSELRVLIAIIDIGGVPEVAASLNL